MRSAIMSLGLIAMLLAAGAVAFRTFLVRDGDELRALDGGGERRAFERGAVEGEALIDESLGQIGPEVIEKADGTVPILGVCLGHQAIGQVYGGKVVRAPEPMHGKMSTIHHSGKSVFRGLNNDFQATRYHSLTIDPPSMPASLEVTATSDDGVIQGVMHKTHPVHGVQFHPESIASENGHALLQNFLRLAHQPALA